jgi:hypothetical protein
MEEACSSEGINLRERCLALFADDRILEAARLEKVLAEKFPKIHSESDEILKTLRHIGEEAARFHAEFESTDGWKCVCKGATPSDISVWIRHEPGNVLHTLRVEGELDAPTELILVLMNEIALFDLWLPFIGGSRELACPSRCERYAWVKLWSPAPQVIHHRDACLYVRAIDDLDEDGCVLVLLRSFEEPAPIARPDLEPRTTRVNVKFGALEFFPTAQKRTRIRAIALVDPKLSILPVWLINWVATKWCVLGMRHLENQAQLLRDKGDDCPHKRCMHEKDDYYQWGIERIRTRVAALVARLPNTIATKK